MGCTLTTSMASRERGGERCGTTFQSSTVRASIEVAQYDGGMTRRDVTEFRYAMRRYLEAHPEMCGRKWTRTRDRGG